MGVIPESFTEPRCVSVYRVHAFILIDTIVFQVVLRSNLNVCILVHQYEIASLDNSENGVYVVL